MSDFILELSSFHIFPRNLLRSLKIPPVFPSSLSMPCHSPSVSQNSLSFFLSKFPVTPSFSKNSLSISFSQNFPIPSSLKIPLTQVLSEISVTFLVSEFPHTTLTQSSLRLSFLSEFSQTLILSLKFSQSLLLS